MTDALRIDPTRFRQVLAHLPTGVTVITAHCDNGPVGMTANSVTSVSLDPPLILFCPAKTSSTWPDIRASGEFCVNVLAHHHAELTRRFAARGVDRFANVSYEHRSAGPALSDAVAWIECRLHQEHDGGDHTIVVARAVTIEAVSGVEPLVFFQGIFGSFLDANVAGGGK
jgi:flavin reductase (DIM6/NTAB) family NADH-FMN oxidoreductase RutF